MLATICLLPAKYSPALLTLCSQIPWTFRVPRDRWLRTASVTMIVFLSVCDPPGLLRAITLMKVRRNRRPSSWTPGSRNWYLCIARHSWRAYWRMQDVLPASRVSHPFREAGTARR